MGNEFPNDEVPDHKVPNDKVPSHKVPKSNKVPTVAMFLFTEKSL